MPQLPDRPNIDHLKNQAKDLLAAYRSGDGHALERFRNALPTMAGKDDTEISALGLRLHDAQSCVAREYGFSSWADLSSFVLASNTHSADRNKRVLNWLRLVYAGDIAGGTDGARPHIAARLLITLSSQDPLPIDPELARLVAHGLAGDFGDVRPRAHETGIQVLECCCVKIAIRRGRPLLPADRAVSYCENRWAAVPHRKRAGPDESPGIPRDRFGQYAARYAGGRAPQSDLGRLRNAATEQIFSSQRSGDPANMARPVAAKVLVKDAVKSHNLTLVDHFRRLL